MSDVGMSAEEEARELWEREQEDRGDHEALVEEYEREPERNEMEFG